MFKLMSLQKLRRGPLHVQAVVIIRNKAVIWKLNWFSHTSLATQLCTLNKRLTWKLMPCITALVDQLTLTPRELSFSIWVLVSCKILPMQVYLRIWFLQFPEIESKSLYPFLRKLSFRILGPSWSTIVSGAAIFTYSRHWLKANELSDTEHEWGQFGCSAVRQVHIQKDSDTTKKYTVFLPGGAQVVHIPQNLNKDFFYDHRTSSYPIY